MTRGQFISRVIKPVLFLVLLLPLALLVEQGFSDNLGANPVETITHQTGLWALRLLLLLTLAITPLCKLTRISELVRLRRMIGVYSFFYALLHFMTYAVLDHSFDMTAILEDVVKRPYVTVGFSAFLMLIPLAATSTNGMIKRLGGKRWKRLHKLVYLCGLGGVIHYLWLVKADVLSPLNYLAIFIVLMLFRLPDHVREKFTGPLRSFGQRSSQLLKEEKS
ncbi:sulfite oxidase heme-binding subunit YedZ [Sedimenticola selenatireducens]|uniref:Protein-methionine-sulfoxide reductase heme-binding subunit MsrQ n=1 Tax=Sedimenticola selenatireducens TaxID=191960 RepID=A0A557SMQ6_9GAMM|nr:protein-methionine-sulfoxide reductase heme-binding subunit MsrQ [Sedimenticola selenatireducens]TVO78707.1 sulfoxide reductase heme-binding subunit YedZ [Sedimenticola selenatireducens]TVT62069.1 MAG: sulfoxide reductase heme-binding subunit YedZ [Sedimenticola selenatireducens]